MKATVNTPVTITRNSFYEQQGIAIKVEGSRIRVLFPRNGNIAPYSEWFNLSKQEHNSPTFHSLYSVWQPVRKQFPYHIQAVAVKADPYDPYNGRIYRP